MGERDAGPVDPLISEVDGALKHLQESDPEKAKGIRDVVIVGTIAHHRPGHIGGLIAALMAKHPELNIVHVETMEAMMELESGGRAREILGMIPERARGIALVPERECSARGWWEQPKSKGERRRERAHNRRLWGKENSF